MQRGGGIISMEDLKNYKAIWRKPHQFKYRDFEITSMGLPSSGGLLLNQMLKMIEPYPISTSGYGSLAAMNLMSEAERRTYRDRALYLGDSDFSEVSVEMLVSDKHIEELMRDYSAGKAGVSEPLENSSAIDNKNIETTHLSVVDDVGKAVALTTTLNGAFGSQVVVGKAGFFKTIKCMIFLPELPKEITWVTVVRPTRLNLVKEF